MIDVKNCFMMEKKMDKTGLLDDAKIATPSGFGQRHMLAVMAFLGFFNVYCLRVNLSVALVAMVNSTNTKNESESGECPSPDSQSNSTSTNTGEFNWDQNTQGIVLGSFFYGYIVTQIPGGKLAETFGGKKMFGFGVLCTALLTLITPLAARFSLAAFIAVRVVEGIGEGVTFPAMHAIWGKWAPLWERSKLAGFCYAGAQLGTVFSMPISGILCGSDFLGGWPSVFYVFGVVACIWFVVWMLVTHDTPAEHPWISYEEKHYIESSIGVREHFSTPWKSIFTSTALWAICAAHFANNWGFYTMLTCLPTYLKSILRYDIKQDGFLSALPYLVCWLSQIGSSFFADFVRSRGYLSTVATRKILTSLGSIIPAVLLFCIEFAGCNYGLVVAMLTMAVGLGGLSVGGYTVNHLDLAPNFAGLLLPAVLLNVIQFAGCGHLVVVVLLTFAVGLGGLCMGGMNVNHLDISPNFAGTLMGITNCLATIPGFLGPYIVGILTDDNETRGQWQYVFYIAGGVYIFGFIVFVIFAEGTEQPWNKPSNEMLSFKGNGVQNTGITDFESSTTVTQTH